MKNDFVSDFVYDFVYDYRKKVVSPEDIEYFECQYEMTMQLFEQCQRVERVIGE